MCPNKDLMPHQNESRVISKILPPWEGGPSMWTMTGPLIYTQVPDQNDWQINSQFLYCSLP